MRKFLAITVLILFATIAADVHAGNNSPVIKQHGWHGHNAAILRSMIKKYGNKSSDFDASHPSVAAFDWDNTIIKNDIGDATLYWMLAHNKILQPTGKDWIRTSPLLSKEALNALYKACTSLARPGEPLITNADNPESRACADEIYEIYANEKTTSGAAAWAAKTQTVTMHPNAAWAVSLQAGYTLAEIRDFAERALNENLAANLDAVQQIGSKKDVTAYIRYYSQIKDLIAAMKDAGFDVWVISASAKPIVEVAAARVGIPADHVIGVRSVITKKGKIAAAFEGCGPYKDGNYDIMTFGQGKRCWLNKAVFGVDPASQMQERGRQLFAAGDSDTDVYFIEDAKYRLVINRNKPELMCTAYFHFIHPKDTDGVWLINPMFIEPKPKKSGPYECAAFNFPDQKDLVY